MQTQTQFVVGQKVKWGSQSQGCWRFKIGFIAEVIQPGTVPPKDKVRLPGGRRNHESYLVQVPNKTGRGKGKYYWPIVSLLQLADPEDKPGKHIFLD